MALVSEISIPESILSVKLNGESVILKDTEMINPFYIPLSGSNVKNSNMKDIYDTYKYIYILCIKEGIKFDTNLLKLIYEYIVSKDDFNKLMQCFTLIKTNISILKLYKHKQLSNIISKSVLDTYFLNYNFEINEIILPILEMKEKNIHLYISLYSNNNSYDNLNKLIQITQYYNGKFNTHLKLCIINYINNISKSFWEETENCNINMTDIFKKRIFNYNNYSNDEDSSIQTEPKIQEVINELSKNNKNINYLDNILDKKFVDIYDVLTNLKNKRTYYATIDITELELNKQTLIDLYLSISDNSQKYYLINNLLISKEYCHIIVNNKEMLKIIKPFFDDYKILFKYTFGYTWIAMYIEECIFNKKCTVDSRFVFTLDTACELPYFPICFDDIWQNPYISCLINKNAINTTKNCMSTYPINDSKYYGVCNQQTFNTRLNLFCTNNKKYDLFEGIDWEHIAISGSIIPACVQKCSPLVNNVSNSDLDNKTFIKFKNQYYTNSDIDVICNKKTILEFLDQATNLHFILESNLNSFHKHETDDKIIVTIESIKTTYINICIDFIDELLDNINIELGINFTKDEILEKIKENSDDILDYIYDLYYNSKKNRNKKLNINKEKIKEKFNISSNILKMHIKRSSCDEIKIKLVKYKYTKNNYNNNDNEDCYFINDLRSDENKVPDDENYLVYKIYEPIRFKYHSDYLQHSVELFQIYNDNFFSIVSKFHFPCVRGFYQKDKVYLLPSAITAFMTGINIDYKYFAGTNDPIKIFNKYRTRGYGSIFNKTELKHMIYYNNNIFEGNEIYNIPSNKKTDIEEALSPKFLNDKIFRPICSFKIGNKINSPIVLNNYLNSKVNYIESITKLKTIYKNEYKYDSGNSILDMFRIKCINGDGNINPVFRWVISGFWDLYGKK